MYRWSRHYTTFSVSSTDSSFQISAPVSVEPACDTTWGGPKEHIHVEHKNPADTAADRDARVRGDRGAGPGPRTQQTGAAVGPRRRLVWHHRDRYQTTHHVS